MFGRPLRRRLSECPSCKSRLSMCLSARHLSACLFHVSASGAIIAAATANSRCLSQQNPYKTCVSSVELGQTSRHFIVHFEKNPNKKVPQVWALCPTLQAACGTSDTFVLSIIEGFGGGFAFQLRCDRRRFFAISSNLYRDFITIIS